MRLTLRFLLLLIVSLALVACLTTLVFNRLVSEWVERDLELQSVMAAQALRVPILDRLKHGRTADVTPLLEQLTKSKRLVAAVLCTADGTPVSSTDHLPRSVSCNTPHDPGYDSDHGLPASGPLLRISRTSLAESDPGAGTLVLVHDLSFMHARNRAASRTVFFLVLALGAVIALVTVLMARFTWREWLKDVQRVIKEKGSADGLPPFLSRDMAPVAAEIKTLICELEAATTRSGRIMWTDRTLRELVEKRFQGEQLIAVANREPYLHVKKNGAVEVQVPASGLVTALEPVLRAVSGSWIAHGSGSGDREVVDANDRVRVPPGEESYVLRRVWLCEEEEQGYYYGFANEGLWPLCHIAHTRPVFRRSDWENYLLVNKRFARAVEEETEHGDPLVLVQDYHFAALPRLIRRRLPRSTVLTFWHIPWPNPEAFGICPWRTEILSGLLGSTILGFHTRYHVNNFLQTADRFLECRIDLEHGTVTHRGHVTTVRSYPISIEWPPKRLTELGSVDQCKAEVLGRHGFGPEVHLAVGVDRLDYTKGILEKLAAIRTFLTDHPQWIGRFALIQIAAPSRWKIDSYRNFAEEVEHAVAELNSRFSSPGVPPVTLLKAHHEPLEVYRYLRAADLCMVMSLHDGMNLVAKEYVAARDDEAGVLILSMFTGASRELSEALIVNPYNAEQCSRAIKAGLEMPHAEQHARMTSLREEVMENNIYRWAGRMLSDAIQIRERQKREESFTETLIERRAANMNM